MKKILLMLSLCCSTFSFATGPSLVDARIHPLSINEKNELLYKYIIAENSTGAQKEYPIMTGIGVFKNNEYTALTQEIIEVDPHIKNSEAAYWIKRGQNEMWFNQACEQDDLVEEFTECNTQQNLADRWFTLAEFKEIYDIDLLSVPHITLSPSDIYASSKDRVFVEYEFDQFLILQFKVESCFENGLATLIMPNTIMNDSANERNSLDPIAFDCTIASAIIMK